MNNFVTLLNEPGGLSIRTVTVDFVINEIGSRPSFLLVLAWLWGTLIPMVGV